MNKNHQPHFELVRNRYPQASAVGVFQVICSILGGNSSGVNWNRFSIQDWELLSEMAIREGVAGLLYAYWKTRQRPAQLPDELFAQLGAAFMRNNLQHKTIMQELLNRIQPALANKSQNLIITKGAALAGSLYPQAGMRPYVDLDCLAAESEIPVIVDMLKELGYVEKSNTVNFPWRGFQEHHHVLYLPQSPALLLELHFTLLNVREDFFTLNLEWFFKQTRPFFGKEFSQSACATHNLLTFNPAAHLLHLAMHLLMHHGEGGSDLLHFYDIYMIVEQWGQFVEWEELQSASMRMNLDYVVFAALEGMAERFGNKIPAAFAQKPFSDHAQPVMNYVETRKAQLPATSTERYLRKLANRPFVSQISIALRFIFPRADYMEWRYRIKPRWLWPLGYLRRWGIGLSHLIQIARRKFKK